MIDTPLQSVAFAQKEGTHTAVIGSASEFLTTLINRCVAQQEPIVLLFDDDSTMTDDIPQHGTTSLPGQHSPGIHIFISTRASSLLSLLQFHERDHIVEVRMDALRSTNDEQHRVHADPIRHDDEKNSLPALPSYKKQAQQEPEKQHASQPLLDPLSTRELEVLQLMAQGASNVEIADSLVIAFATVKRHVSNILSKLQANNRTQAVACARRLRLLH